VRTNQYDKKQHGEKYQKAVNRHSVKTPIQKGVSDAGVTAIQRENRA